MESGETPVVVRILRSGAKLLQQPGKSVTLTSYPPSQVMSKGKKFNKIPPLSPGQDRERKLKKIQNPVSLKDSSGPFNFGVRFTRNSKLCENTDWAFNYKYKRLYVDMDSWVPVLFNMKDFTRAQTQFQVRVTAVLSDLNTSTSSASSTTSASSYPPFHLIRLAESSHTSYQQDNQSRHSVIFPISSSAPTCRKIKFTSLSSDLGREVKAVFSLEDGEGEVVGRRVFSVKIRAGPDNI